MEVSPKLILAQHQELIEELIPYQLNGRLKAEIQSLAGTMSLIERKLVEREVMRLCAPCRKHLDLSERSNLAVESFNHSGCEIVVCQVGKQLFEDQLNRFKGKYTVGVFESVTSSSLFNEYLKEHRQEKIREAFTLPAGRLAEKIDPAKLKLTPNIKLTLPGLKKPDGKPATAQCYYLTPVALVLESNDELDLAEGDICQIQYPKVAGLTEEPQRIYYKAHQTVFDKRRESFLTRFAILRRELRWAKKIKHYMETKGHELPAIFPQEKKRTGLELAKAQLLAASDWVPIFCTLNPKSLNPLSILQTPTNATTIANLSLNDEFIFCPSWLTRISKTLIKQGECDLLWLRRGGNTYVATLDEAKQAEQLDAFINPDTLKGDLQILKCRLVRLSKQDHASVLTEIKGAKSVIGPQLNSILYIKDMAKLSRQLQPDTKSKLPPPSEQFIQANDTAPPLQLLIAKQNDRRQESRYQFTNQVYLRAHFIRKFTGQLLDLSVGGMKVQLDKPLKTTSLKSVRADVESLHLRKIKRSGVKFKVLEYIPEKRWLRLQVVHKHQKLYEEHIHKLQRHNQKLFEQRDIQAQYRTQYDAMSLLASHRHPGVHVRLKQGRIETRRLVQVLLGDLFSDANLLQNNGGKQMMLHRLFADKNAEYPSSSILSELFQSAEGESLCLFQCDPKTMALTRIRPERLRDNTRRKLVEAADDNLVQIFALWLSVSSLDSLDSESTNDLLHRLAKLGATSLAVAKKELMSVKHNLSITDVSPLVMELLRRGRWPSQD